MGDDGRLTTMAVVTPVVSLQIPISRADIVKTKVFSLRQKRQLTAFLEWCFTVSVDEDSVVAGECFY